MALRSALSLLFALSACADDPPADCALGDLGGTWRAVYEEETGDDPTSCGPLAPTVARLDAINGKDPASGCTPYAALLTDGACRLDYDYACPTATGGAARFVGITRQTGDDKAETRFRLVISGGPGGGLCAGTYRGTLTRL